MDNWKVIGTILAGVLIVGWFANENEETDIAESLSTNSVVSVSEAEEPREAKSTEEPEREQAKAPSHPPSPWRVREDTSQMDDSTNVFLTTTSNERIPGRYGRTPGRATLYVRCVENTTALVLQMNDNHMASSPYHSWGDVQMRIDDERAFTKSMTESTNNKSLGLWSGGQSIPVIRQMFSADQLTVRATPFSESPITMTFDINGLEDEIEPLREACHW